MSRRIAPYALCGLFVWVCVLESGVHATLAGVAMAFAIPMRSKRDERWSPARELEHALHPWVTFGIMPLFAVANAGVPLGGLTYAQAFSSLTLGIAAGLFVGKQIGVFAFGWTAIRLGIADKPADATWHQFYGVAILTGIGFTMSLFIGTLAFDEGTQVPAIRLGVLAGSVLSALVGFLVLRLGQLRA